MMIKVCGLKEVDNILQLDQMGMDLMGFIFYPKSPRYPDFSEKLVATIRSVKTKKVGVFVNATKDEILDTVELFKLDMVQLHGDESALFVSEMASYIPVIKVFNVQDELPENLSAYRDADYFLFDAKGRDRGGNGIKFDWEILRLYKGDIPFLLSGGIHLEDIRDIIELGHPKMIGFDVNSGFELEPGVKNIELLKELKARTNEVYC